MANVKITELTAATALAGTDVLPIVDVGADATKKVSVSDLMRNLPDGTASAPALAFADDQNTGVLSPGNNSLAFATSGTQRLVIDSSGRVGINVTSPTRKFQVAGGGTSIISNIARTDGTSCLLTFSDNATSSDAHVGIGAFGNNMLLRSGNAERMRIDSSGNVGIGTSSPGAALHIENTGSDAAKLRIGFDSTRYYDIFRKSSDGLGLLNFHGSQTGFTGYVFGGVDGERMRIDSSGNVGIGTSSPDSYNSAANDLVIEGGSNTGVSIASSSATGNSRIYFADGTSGSADRRGQICYEHTNDIMFFATGASEAARIDSSGRLLVGTSSVIGSSAVDAHYAKLQVVGRADGGTNEGRIAIVRNENSASITDQERIGRIVFADQQEGTYALIDCRADGNAGSNDYPGNLIFSTTADGASAATERMRINSSGRVGIGTTSPAGTFDVSGNARIGAGSGGNFENAATRLLVANTGGDAYIQIQAADSTGTSGIKFGRNSVANRAGIDWSASTDALQFRTGGTTERMRIESSGTVTCLSTSAPMLWARAQTSGSVTALAFYNNPSSIETLSGQVFRVMCDGDVENSNNNYGSISDIKLKENIVDAGSQWDDIKSLRVRKYNFKKSTGLSTHTQIGLVAQEAETVSPGLVKDRFDSDETGKETETVTKSVNYSVLYMKAVKALQEAMERIETLETKVAALEAQ